ncbi:MAG: rhomboid family intramembrane serine protease [Saprospiraceae bacterium]|nr:rhomboid family intramembrane serine protease [Saprospiraceae bacterium]
MFNYTSYGTLGGSYALGASAAVMSMLATAAFVAPDYIFNVLLIGPVKLKYIALVLFLLDLLGIANQINTGGHFAHLGGAAFGILYASQLRKGIDLIKPINLIIDWFSDLFQGKLGKKKRKLTYQRGEKEFVKNEKQQRNQAKGSRRSDAESVSEQERLDLILDKIKQRGYESLTKEEKEFLFNASKK